VLVAKYAIHLPLYRQATIYASAGTPIARKTLTQWVGSCGVQLVVNTENFATSEPGIFAVGDINTYPGKKKLILCGFHEATLAAFGAVALLRPEEKTLLQYTTTFTLLHQRLGL
jgi:hypothetical protein